ncbi:DUF1488 family protein [Sandarakinorhabdus sp. DWP1-3-1]|uniref:DUF1488 family protein n=1 Tax=Sandarakinorhabdus sp. DWP1-3-1 TaxID=2804627 RepID=UPI003CEE0F74
MARRIFEIDTLAAHDFDHGRVNFRGRENGKVINCSISDEALQDMSGSIAFEPDQLLAIFGANAFDIGEIAEAKLNANALEADGSIRIRAADVC